MPLTTDDAAEDATEVCPPTDETSEDSASESAVDGVAGREEVDESINSLSVTLPLWVLDSFSTPQAAQTMNGNINNTVKILFINAPNTALLREIIRRLITPVAT